MALTVGGAATIGAATTVGGAATVGGATTVGGAAMVGGATVGGAIAGGVRWRRRAARAVRKGALRLNDGPSRVLTRRRLVIAQVDDCSDRHQEPAHDPRCLTPHKASRGFVKTLAQIIVLQITTVDPAKSWHTSK